MQQVQWVKMKKVFMKCNACGKCCKIFKIIGLSIRDIKKLSEIGYKPDDFAEVVKGEARMKKSVTRNACVFLEEDNKCWIHKENGFESKPDVCREFPYSSLLCGIPSWTDKNIPEKKIANGDKYFFMIGKKNIPVSDFAELINKMNIKKRLIESYIEILKNILEQKENIIIKPIKINNKNIKISRSLERKILRNFLVYSNTFFPKTNLILGNEVIIKFPTGKFKFKLYNKEIPETIKKQFLPYLTKEIVQNKRDYRYHEKLISFLYLLPHLSQSLAGEKNVELPHVIHAFSLLNSLNKFYFFNQRFFMNEI